MLNGMVMVSLLLMPWIDLALRKADWILISLLGCGYSLFYALFSHFIPRHSDPLIPVSLVYLSLLFLAALRQASPLILSIRKQRVE